MKIKLEKAGKKFYHEWIFRNLDQEFCPNDFVAIVGPNGSGKSTLLQLIAGSIIPTEGIISYYEDEQKIEGDYVFKQISFASPYLELIEEFTLQEIVHFHFHFKQPVHDYSEEEIISLTGLQHVEKKIFKYFSSGMKQRVKLALALLSDSKIILLDEPCSNLDEEAVKWYRQLINVYSKNKIVIVCSNNQSEEFDFCNRTMNLMDWKSTSSV